MNAGNRKQGRPVRVIQRVIIAMLLMGGIGAANAAKPDLDYERLRGSLNQLRDDRVLGALAPGEIALAEQSLAVLAEQGGHGREHDHLVYIAERRVDVAYATAQAAERERALQQLDREHDQILLAASRRDAEQSRLELEKQRIQSLAQAEESDRLRAEADAARAQNEQSTAQFDTAKKQAAQARKLADAQAREAELARKEAELLAASGAKAPPKAAVAAPLTLSDSAFAPGQSALKPAAQAQINKIAAAAGASASVHVEAHADDAGSAKANLALARARAQAVRDALVATGIAPERISAIGRAAQKGGHQIVVSFSAH
jgi:outer membrane protein OmpA-like peptidoglycan-associated protein